MEPQPQSENLARAGFQVRAGSTGPFLVRKLGLRASAHRDCAQRIAEAAAGRITLLNCKNSKNQPT
jgi:hypothetical protein